MIDEKEYIGGVVERCMELSFYSIQKSLILAIKRSLLNADEKKIEHPINVSVNTWNKLIELEKENT